MATALTKTPGKAVATAGAHNPYKQLATAVSPKNIYGELLKFSKGDWVAGEHNTEIPKGTELIAIMDKLATGWVRWENQKPTEQHMVEVEKGTPPRRAELGDDDRSLWEKDDRGQVRDPWQFTMYLPMISEDGKPYTFAASSKGGINAIGKLAGEYGEYIEGDDGALDYPIVSLGVDSYMHPNKAYGRIKVPTLAVEDYIPRKNMAAKIAAALQGGPDKGQPDESENPGDGMDDEIPF